MSKKSQTVKEILQIVIFLVVAGILLVTFVIYPLGKSKEIMGRANIDEYNEDSLPPNYISLQDDSTLSVDTMRADSDGLTTIALAVATRVPGDDSLNTVSRGTAVLLHSESTDRDAMLPLARQLLDSGFTVVLYDQRASGRSTGTYHSDGQYEADDLEAVIAYLTLREKLPTPVMVVGKGAGADAALLASLDDSRIETVIAVEPYLTTDRWYSLKREASGMWWIPFPNSLLSFWYEIRSSYALRDRSPELFEPVPCRTLLIEGKNAADDPILRQYIELSSGDLLTTHQVEPGEDKLDETILEYVTLTYSEPIK